jgi:chorismate-pyruvate lyase
MRIITFDHKISSLLTLIEQRLSNLLLQMDSSTTRILTALVGGTLTVNLKHQDTIEYQDIPEEIQGYFAGKGPFLHRVTSLTYHEEALSDNAVFADINLLSPELRDDIYQGKIPLGLLIANTENRRQFLAGSRMKLDEVRPLFTPVDLNSGESLVKKYLIIKEQRCWFYICETFHLEKLIKYFLDV